MGVIDTMQITHNPLGLASSNSPDVNAGLLANEQRQSWKDERGIILSGNILSM